mmetsp:Transcript_9806/g.20741  ORF Transcript_9806/g.20741 Transcript_9806/m.20741 type:complete len:294 (+) Transcript_9806:192-1073(+)
MVWFLSTWHHLTEVYHRLAISYRRRQPIELGLRQLVPPVKQRLPRHGGRRDVVPRPSRLHALSDEERPPPSPRTDRLDPARHLPFVVDGATSEVEAAVPLEPAVRVLRSHPTLPLPEGEVVAALDAVFVDALAVDGRNDRAVDVESFEPVGGEFEVDAFGEARSGRLGDDGPEVGAAERSRAKYLVGGEVGTELRMGREREAPLDVAFGEGLPPLRGTSVVVVGPVRDSGDDASVRDPGGSKVRVVGPRGGGASREARSAPAALHGAAQNAEGGDGRGSARTKEHGEVKSQDY